MIAETKHPIRLEELALVGTARRYRFATTMSGADPRVGDEKEVSAE